MTLVATAMILDDCMVWDVCYFIVGEDRMKGQSLICVHGNSRIVVVKKAMALNEMNLTIGAMDICI